MKGKEVRNIVLTTKVNNRELEEINHNAMIRNTRVSTHLRESALNYNLPHKEPTDYNKFLRNLCYIGNNLNQIARKFNSKDFYYCSTLEPLVKELKKLVEEIKEERKWR